MSWVSLALFTLAIVEEVELPTVHLAEKESTILRSSPYSFSGLVQECEPLSVIFIAVES